MCEWTYHWCQLVSFELKWIALNQCVRLQSFRCTYGTSLVSISKIWTNWSLVLVQTDIIFKRYRWRQRKFYNNFWTSRTKSSLAIHKNQTSNYTDFYWILIWKFFYKFLEIDFFKLKENPLQWNLFVHFNKSIPNDSINK